MRSQISHVQLFLKKIPHGQFFVQYQNIHKEHPQLSEKAVDSPSVANYIFICVRLAFLPILQSKHHVTKD